MGVKAPRCLENNSAWEIIVSLGFWEGFVALELEFPG